MLLAAALLAHKLLLTMYINL